MATAHSGTHPQYPQVFSKARIGPVNLPNRYYFSPHGLPLTVGCAPSNDLVSYCMERVRDGGCGLVILSCTAHERGRHFQPCPYPESTIPAFRALADAVHAAGGRIFAQIWYHWLATGHWQPMAPAAPPFGPSASQFAFGGVSGASHACSKSEIARMTDAHRQSARHLREAGFDGIEIHASHSGMIEQFLSPYFNRRTDEYGGSLDNRMRLLVETLQAVREEAGPDMAVGMRLNCDEMIEGGYDTGDAAKILARTRELGLLDFVDLDVAMEPLQLEYGMPTGFVPKHVYTPFVERMRDAAGDVPILSVLGRITRMADAEAALESGLCDMVGSTRELIAEPSFVRHARNGTEHLGRTCIACNWCLGGMNDGAFGCTINPASYRERLWGEGTFTPASERCNVAVVGGGPSGMEAARVAALRGHSVTLYEARDRLGGAVEPWSRLPGRENYGPAIDWWAEELARLGVDVKLGTCANADLLMTGKPDAVIVATGARFSRSGRCGIADRPIPGAGLPHVISVDDVLSGPARPSGRIVLLDAEGTHASAGIAEMLAAQGSQVTMISSNYAPFSNRLLFAFEGIGLARRLAAAGVEFIGGKWVSEITPGGLKIYDVNAGAPHDVTEMTGIDAVVLATGRLPVDDLASDLEGKVAQLFVIGDALAVRPWATAAYEGHKFARLIGEPGAPATTGDAFFETDNPEIYPSPADAE